jgi:arylsulfatase
MAGTSPAPAGPPPFPPDARNVVVIVLDDLGFAQLGCYGSDLATPNIDRLAAGGVRFTNFHTTAVCSPTRACLLTGRNHHRVGMGMLPDLPTNFPGYDGQFPDGAGTLAQVLRQHGWATYCVGKWHLTPRDQRDTGPYRMWPTGCGFDRYYGFLNGETNQWTPNLVHDTNHVEPPASPEEGYHLTEDLADRAIGYLTELRDSHPDRPFLLWFATAAPHAPHQVPPEWIEPYRGRFDDGWDAWRTATLERQVALGVVAAGTELSERPDWVEPWEAIDADRRRLYARMMEVCAGFITHTDHHVGRVLDHLEATGEAERTVVVLVSDNGCSAEGGPHGTWNQLGHYISDEPDDIGDELVHLDDLGGFRSSGHYPWGWALAGNTPFQRWKRYTFEGGVRDPLVVRVPTGGEPGAVRHQYVHAVDVMPTLLDLVGLDLPTRVDGHEQMSIDGTSFVAALDDPGAPDPRTAQYFECWGSRAIYADGWKAVTDHVNQLTANERLLMEGSHDFASDRWALFDCRTDPTEQHDLAAEYPDRLRALVERWWELAEANDVLPLDDGTVGRFAHMRLPWTAWRSSFDLRPGAKVHEATGPNLAGGFRLTAAFDAPVGHLAEAVLCEQGDALAGWAWYVVDDELRWAVSGKDGLHEVTAPVPPDARLLSADATVGPDGLTIALAADGQTLATATLAVTLPLAWAPDGAFLTVGYGRPFPVTDAYRPPATAPASLAAVRITVGPPPPLDVDAELARVMRHQ